MEKREKTSTRAANYPQWYQQVIQQADLAEAAPVRGCMTIKPWGYAIWEKIQRHLDVRLKETGHTNAYFPLLIPKTLLEKEAEHVHGFAKECAVVTHHRLEASEEGGLFPADPLEEPLVVRPTSEAIIGPIYARWIQSYRDLPLLINQWANVIRWEKRTRLFLRTTEFLWQEGHTCHATREEALEETRRILDLYAQFASDCMAIPVIKGVKTAQERFPGAVDTYTVEAMMQDRKALQVGTSHFLGQNFAKAAKITFLDNEGKQQHAWTTSWGVSTRLIGALIMTHSDDQGLVLPPCLAPRQVVLLPLWRDEEQKGAVLAYSEALQKELREQIWKREPLEVTTDHRDLQSGRHWEFIKKGVPILIEVGPREVKASTVCMRRRDQPDRKTSLTKADFVHCVPALLQEIHNTLYQRALTFRCDHTHPKHTVDELRAFFTPPRPESPEPHGGFALAYVAEEASLQPLLDELKVTIRCIPFDEKQEGTCILTGVPTNKRLLLAKAY